MFNLEKISNERLSEIIEEISKETNHSEADTYDYIINYLFSRYKIPNSLTP